MGLEMKKSCERCQGGLELAEEAFICSYECTFCSKCAAQLRGQCPNCSGKLVARPERPSAAPASAGSAQHGATVEWSRGGAQFVDQRYSRVHIWRFDGGTEIRASSSPHVVQQPYSDASAVDPEEGFLAALSSCHMLWFLSLAAHKGYVVEHYTDQPVGTMSALGQDRSALAHVILKPQVSFADTTPCASGELEALHHEAHRQCYLASALRYPIRIEPQS